MDRITDLSVLDHKIEEYSKAFQDKVSGKNGKERSSSAGAPVA